MPTERNDLDALYCQKVHEAILDDAPVILTLFMTMPFSRTPIWNYAISRSAVMQTSISTALACSRF